MLVTWVDCHGPSGLYYKPIMIVNDDSSVGNKLETSLIDDARGVIYARHMFIVQATQVGSLKSKSGLGSTTMCDQNFEFGHKLGCS